MTEGRGGWFNDSDRYGFVESDRGHDVFVHFSAIQDNGDNGFKPLSEV